MEQMTAYLQQKYQVILEAKNYNTYVHGYRISSNIILECDHEFYYLNQIQFPSKQIEHGTPIHLPLFRSCTELF